MDVNLYLIILKAFLNKDKYETFRSYLNLDLLDKNHPELYRLFVALDELHKQGSNSTQYTLEDLRLGLFTLYPKANSGSYYDPIFKQLDELSYSDDAIMLYLRQLESRGKALKLAKQALDIAEGKGEYTDLRIEEETVIDDESWKENFVVNDYVKLMEARDQSPGLHWRLPSLNAALGPLRKGNFGFVFARPETGKTTFLASEISYMAEQTDRPVIWFNNEQAGEDVMKRAIQGALGWTEAQMEEDREATREAFMLNHSNFIINDDGDTTKREVERICKAVNPALIVFDQIDAIKGFAADRNDLELKAIYEWARALCKTYGPVIGICQAGGSGEEKKWLTMNDVDSSKTGKQGTADWILGIGCIHEPGSEYLRFMHLSKNKLQGDKNSDPQMRHGRWTVFMRPEIARYEEIGG